MSRAESTAPLVVLASTSRYRAELLRRLLPEFALSSPGTDESALPNEAPDQRARRLAISKATAVASQFNGTLVIGSDQVAELDGFVLDKPGTTAQAVAQLTACSSRSVIFHTALCLLDTRTGEQDVYVDQTTVRFRELSTSEIERYIAREQPLDCAGSFKCEALGISLFESIDNRDPTALIGLPLIALAHMLRDAGVPIP